jgi:LCP family protein required for cell wall assembly
VSPDPGQPPRLGLGLLKRAALAGVLISLLTAGAVSGAVLLQVDDVINIIEREGRAPIEIPEIDRADAGSPRTIMILGSDARYGDRKGGLKPRSDTIILVRLDPDQKVTAVTSIPRDLLAEIPGYGRTKINTAYEAGGARLTLKTVKQLLSTPERPFKINHVVTIDFGGFRRLIDYVGCVYADIDHDYFNDKSSGENYATIDIDPGYQKICGRDALDYVRYRHTDNDLVRAARQQDFLRQVRNQQGVAKLRDPRKIRTLARIFATYFDSDRSLRRKSQILSLAKLVLFSAEHPVREVRFRVADAPDRVNLVSSPQQLRTTVDEFLEAKASSRPRAAQRPTKQDRASQRSRRKRKRNKAADVEGLEVARREGEDQAIVAARRAKFPFYFPTLRYRASAYVGRKPRVYGIRDELGKLHRAYRLVISKGVIGEYYGVQGMTWRYPPILDDPSETVRRKGRTLLVYRDGRRVRLVAWRTKRAVYWVSNTLTQSLGSEQMIGIAASLRRFPTP